MVNTIKLSSVIAGIHITNVGSHPNIKLVVEDDNSNPNIDPDCVLVRHPSLEDLPPTCKQLVTYPKSQNSKSKRKEDQFAYQVSGCKVGNVPAKLCGLFRQLKRGGLVTRIDCFSVGERPRPSIQPPTKQKFSLHLNRRGGGLVLDCEYVLVLAHSARTSKVLQLINLVKVKVEGLEIVEIIDEDDRKQLENGEEELVQNQHEQSPPHSQDTAAAETAAETQQQKQLQQEQEQQQKQHTQQQQRQKQNRAYSFLNPGVKRRKKATGVIFDSDL